MQEMQTESSVVKGTVIDVDASDKAKVVLTIETENGATFEEPYDYMFNTARAIDFAHLYGKHVVNAEGVDVNVYTGDSHMRILRSHPLKTIGGKVLVSEDTELPVEMN